MANDGCAFCGRPGYLILKAYLCPECAVTATIATDGDRPRNLYLVRPGGVRVFIGTAPLNLNDRDLEAMYGGLALDITRR